LEKKGRDAASQLAKELLIEVPDSLEIPLVQPNSTTTKAKLTALTMRKSKSKPKLLKKPSQSNSKALESFPELFIRRGKDIRESRSRRKIVLPERFKQKK
jgi:hypothetical protein